MGNRGFWRGTALLATLAAAALSTVAVGRNTLIQDRLWDHLEHAQSCLADGRHVEAQAYAEMILLRKEVRYAVDYSTAPASVRADVETAVQDAIKVWEEALDGDVKYVPADWAYADVRIKFRESIRHYGVDVAGLATWTRHVTAWSQDRFFYQVRGDISIRTATPLGTDMSLDALRHSVIHELGHILGLQDSYRFGDVMAPLDLARPVTRPSELEVGMLQELRDEASMVLYQASIALKADESSAE